MSEIKPTTGLEREGLAIEQEQNKISVEIPQVKQPVEVNQKQGDDIEVTSILKDATDVNTVNELTQTQNSVKETAPNSDLKGLLASKAPTLESKLFGDEEGL